MGRKRRVEEPGAYYHVHTRGNDRQPIYFGNWSGRLFLRELERAAARYEWRILAYCLMNNHYHLVLQIGDLGLSRGMCELNGRFATLSNLNNKRIDHLFGKRFGGHLISSQSYLFEALRYALLNPVRAGTIGDPLQWRWSSMRATLGQAPAPKCLNVGWVLAHFAEDQPRAKLEFRRFVNAGIGLPRPVPGTEG